jgi:hypothetical protein
LSSEDLQAWFAFPGPKQGNKRPVWLRTRKDDSITGLETGVIQKAFGSYGTKLVLRYGGLNINTRAVEVGIGTLRETRKCPSGGWPFKLQTKRPRARTASRSEANARRVAVEEGASPADCF